MLDDSRKINGGNSMILLFVYILRFSKTKGVVYLLTCFHFQLYVVVFVWVWVHSRERRCSWIPEESVPLFGAGRLELLGAGARN